MKKLICLIAALLLTVCTISALADTTVALGSSGMTMLLPASYETEQPSSSEAAEGIVLFISGDNLAAAIYVDDVTGYTLQELVSEYYQEYTGTYSNISSGTVNIGGTTWGYIAYTYEGYPCVDYFTLVGNTEIYFQFDFESSSADQEARSLLATVGTGYSSSYSSGTTASVPSNGATLTGSSVSITGTGLSFTLPSGYSSESLTSEERADGMIAYYSGSSIDFAIWVDDAQGYTTEDLVSGYVSQADAQASGTTVINGRTWGYMAYEETDDGDTYVCVDYFTVVNGTEVYLGFYMYDTTASAEAAAIMESIR